MFSIFCDDFYYRPRLKIKWVIGPSWIFIVTLIVGYKTTPKF